MNDIAIQMSVMTVSRVTDQDQVEKQVNEKQPHTL